MPSIANAASLNRAAELRRLRAAAAVVNAVIPPTPQYCWPLLSQALGAAVWVKHENHTEVGAFKVRGGLNYLHALRRRDPELRGVIAATRGNHGQSIALAARKQGMSATIVVPHGNSVEKNAAMRALGAELVEAGEDFQASREAAARQAAERGLHLVPAFHEDLVAGVASYWLEFSRRPRRWTWSTCRSAWARASARRRRRAMRSGCRRASSAWCRRMRDAMTTRSIAARRFPRRYRRNWPTAWHAGRRMRRRWR